MAAKKWMAVVAMTVALGAAGCVTKPVYNVQAAPVTSNKTPLTNDDVAKAIVRAGAGLGWQMAEVQPGLITGTLHLRTHVAELRRLEQEGARPDEVAERRRLILRLQDHLAYAVRDLVSIPRRTGTTPPR